MMCVLKNDPNMIFVDMGSGRGFVPFALELLGVERRRIFAVDPRPDSDFLRHTHKNLRFLQDYKNSRIFYFLGCPDPGYTYDLDGLAELDENKISADVIGTVLDFSGMKGSYELHNFLQASGVETKAVKSLRIEPIKLFRTYTEQVRISVYDCKKHPILGSKTTEVGFTILCTETSNMGLATLGTKYYKYTLPVCKIIKNQREIVLSEQDKIYNDIAVGKQTPFLATIRAQLLSEWISHLRIDHCVISSLGRKICTWDEWASDFNTFSKIRHEWLLAECRRLYQLPCKLKSYDIKKMMSVLCEQDIVLDQTDASTSQSKPTLADLMDGCIEMLDLTKIILK
jgi:hypothetical protein